MLGLLSVVPVFAEEVLVSETVLPRVKTPTERLIDMTQFYVGGTMQSISGSLDSFISRDPSLVENESYMRLRLARVFEEGGESYSRHDFSARLDLPKTKGRMQLLVESDNRDLESLAEQKRNVSEDQSSLRNEDNSVSAAVRFLLPDISDWNPSFDVGVRAQTPPNPFTRFRVHNIYAMPDLWHFRTNHEISFYHQQGLRQQSFFIFDRPLGDDWLFANTAEWHWRKKDAELEYDNILAFTHFHTEYKTYVYRTGAFFQERPKSQLQSYFVEINYRRKLYRDWLYAEMIPALHWRREQDFKSQASLTFRLQIFFRN